MMMIVIIYKIINNLIIIIMITIIIIIAITVKEFIAYIVPNKINIIQINKKYNKMNIKTNLYHQ